MTVTVEYRGRLLTGDAWWQEDDHSRCGGGWVASTDSIQSIELPCGKLITKGEQILRWLAAIGYQQQCEIERALAHAADAEERAA